MSTLGLTDFQSLGSLDPEPPPQKKSAAAAFLISLLMPGMGQVYVRRATAGWLTFAFFFLFAIGGAASFVSGKMLAGWTAVYIVVPLYVFGFLDAYFSALEYNQGIASYTIGGNPRIACILNFLTNGIGYFYLGERAKGVLMFLGLGILRRMSLSYFPHHLWLNCLWIVLQAVLAFDAYRLAKRRLLESFPQLANHSWRAAADGQLTPAVPILLALVIAVPIVGLTALGGFAGDSNGVQIGADDVQSTPQGVLIQNKELGLKLMLPDGWQISRTPGDNKFEAHKMREENTCRIILMRSFSWSSPGRFQGIIDRQLSKKPGFSIYGHTSGMLGDRPAALMNVGVGTGVTEKIASARIGYSMYTLFGIFADPDGDCPAQLDGIRNSFRAQR